MVPHKIRMNKKTLEIVRTSLVKKKLSEVVFEPTPTSVDQNTPFRERDFTLESGALDRSAILTEDKRNIWKIYK